MIANRMMSLGRYKLVTAAVLLLLLVVVFFPGLGSAPKHYGDNVMFTASWPVWSDDGGLIDIWSGEHHPADKHWRPFADSILWTAHQLWGDSYLGYQLLNLIVHFGAVVGLLSILRTLRIPHPFPVSVCVALHPIAVQSVFWNVQFYGLLADLLSVAAILALMQFYARSSLRWAALGLLFMALAMLSKTTALSLPFVVFGLTLVCDVHWTRHVYLVVAASFLIAIAVGTVDLIVNVYYSTGEAIEFSHVLGIRERIVSAILQAVRNIMVPFPLLLFYDFKVSWMEVVCGTIVVGLIIVHWRVSGRKALVQGSTVVAMFVSTFFMPSLLADSLGWSPIQDRYLHLGVFILFPYFAVVVDSVRARLLPWFLAPCAMAMFVLTLSSARNQSDSFALYGATKEAWPEDQQDSRMIMLERGLLWEERYAEALQLPLSNEASFIALLGTRQYGKCLEVDGQFYFVLEIAQAAIRIESPDPWSRDEQRGRNDLSSITMRYPFLPTWHWRMVTWVTMLSHASQENFELASAGLLKLLADPALQHDGKWVVAIRNDLKQRLAAFQSRRRVFSLEVLLDWVAVVRANTF